MARLLGRESVSSDTAALFELVKNGYDADAPKVTIKFENLIADEGRNGRIIIEDSGEGMTTDDIMNKWMVIGTYSKERETVTKRGRIVVGNKGVGRFATEKLARRAIMISRPKETNAEIKLEIDWAKFEDEKVGFDDVGIPMEINPNRTEPNKHGLKIILTELREKWDAKKIQRLNTSISSIVLPPELQKQNDCFIVEIHTDEFKPEIPPRVESSLLKKAPYSISAILPDGETQATVQIKKKGNQAANKVVECADNQMASGNLWKPFGGCKIQAYVYPHTTRYDDWNSYYSDVLKLSQVRAVVRENHGLKIYRDGIWVSPYGGPGNDWAGLDAARVQANLKTGNSQVIGFVKITKEKNREIRDTTSRERLEENIAFESMRYFVRRVFEELYHFRKDEAQSKKESSPQIHEAYISRTINRLVNAIDENRKLGAEAKKQFKSSLRQISTLFDQYTKQSKSDYVELEEQERAYRNLASLGISSAASYHEIFNLIAVIKETPTSIKYKLADLGVEDEELDELVRELDVQVDAISTYTAYMREFVKNVRKTDDKPKKTEISLKPEIASLMDIYARIADTHVEFNVKCYPEDLAVFMNKTDFLSLMLNLLANSLKALDEKGPSTKKIQVTATMTGTSLEIKFSDNGKGILDYQREQIFRPLFSTYNEGTGMGLPIISEILENYTGKIQLLPDSEFDSGATFLLQIPWVNIKNE